MILHKCTECGKAYYAKNRNPNNKYCSDACSQSAYRKRKKVEREAKESTLTMEQWLIYDEITRNVPHAKAVLDPLYARYGALMFGEWLIAINELAKIGVES